MSSTSTSSPHPAALAGEAARTASPGPAARRAARPAGRTAPRSPVFGWLCVIPYLALLLAFGIGPLAYAGYASIANPGGDNPPGVGGFSRAFSDFRFLPALGNVAEFMAIYLPVMVVGVLVLALAVQDVRPRYGATLRLLYMLPGAVTGSASVLLWYFMLDPDVSPFSPAPHAMGFHVTTDVFQQSNMLYIFALIAFSTGFGQWVVIMYGALQGVPRELMEAASLDGCSWWQTAVHVKLPLVSKYVLYMVILAFTAGLQIFIEPTLFYAIASVGSSWWSLNQLAVYFAFNNGDFAAASALSLLLMAVCVIAAALLIFKAKFFDTEVD